MGKRKKGNGKYHYWITEEGLIKIEGWAKDGLTDEDIAHNIGIRRETLYAWKNKYPNICNSLKEGKVVADRRVESALYRRALGYEYVEEKVTREKDQNGKDVSRREVYTKKALPDTTAQIFWLKNRKPAEWRDRHNVENTNINLDTTEMTAEERDKRIAELKKKLI